MKRVFVTIFSVCMFLLCGCSFSPSMHNGSNDIETLKGWSFQSNPGTNDYSLFFGLLNSNDKYIAADVDVDIRIVDDAVHMLVLRCHDGKYICANDHDQAADDPCKDRQRKVATRCDKDLLGLKKYA